MPETDIPVAESTAWVARIVLGVTFLVSGSGKLRHLDGLVFGILRYQILPANWAWKQGDRPWVVRDREQASR